MHCFFRFSDVKSQQKQHSSRLRDYQFGSTITLDLLEVSVSHYGSGIALPLPDDAKLWNQAIVYTLETSPGPENLTL